MSGPNIHVDDVAVAGAADACESIAQRLRDRAANPAGGDYGPLVQDSVQTALSAVRSAMGRDADNVSALGNAIAKAAQELRAADKHMAKVDRRMAGGVG
ncbi:MAG: hypothetical protein FWD74_07755 [Actinomycetia bacterium]|nr:hypothetical protein [Actinomycetes bacterium]